ncbi:hypothetical protein [Brachyspira innocens]|uniref:hypothetical protein n=1 Tax=Brachyspira innocens TaxID=13264 RepID=UPI000371CDEB|nr:hypothetical protein [Brachyspira innocens]
MQKSVSILKIISSVLTIAAFGCFAYGGLIIFQTCREVDNDIKNKNNYIEAKNSDEVVGFWYNEI